MSIHLCLVLIRYRVHRLYQLTIVVPSINIEIPRCGFMYIQGAKI